MGDATGTVVTPSTARVTVGFWPRLIVVGLVAVALTGLAVVLAERSPTSASVGASAWLAAVVAVTYAVVIVNPLLHTDRGHGTAIDAGSVVTMAALVVLAPRLLVAAIVVGHAVGWSWHRHGQGMPLVSAMGSRKLLGNGLVHLAHVATALLVHTLVCDAFDLPAPICAAVAVTVAEAVSLVGLAVLIGDRPLGVVRTHVRTVLGSPAPLVVLVVGGLVASQAPDPVATAAWLVAAVACLWALGRHQLRLHDELEQQQALLDVARDLPTRPDRASVERLLLDRARAVTHAGSATLELGPPTGASFGVPLDGDASRWLAVHDRRHAGETFRPSERETLRGLATLGGLALRTVALTEELQHAATHDQLTGLLSRRGLEDHWGQAVARANRHGHSLGVVYVDLDGFKQVNDRRGHAAGDAVLRATAARLRQVARDSDLVCRMGGDEFLLVAEGVGDAEALDALVARVRAALGPRPDGAAAIPASVGAGRLPEDGTTLDEVVRAADAAMYRDKRR